MQEEVDTIYNNHILWKKDRYLVDVDPISEEIRQEWAPAETLTKLHIDDKNTLSGMTCLKEDSSIIKRKNIFCQNFGNRAPLDMSIFEDLSVLQMGLATAQRLC